MELYKVCEAKKIPVLSHCGGGATRHNVSKWIVGTKKIIDESGNLVDKAYKINSRPRRKKKQKMAETFNAPNHWIPVAETFPNLKINLAHFGSDLEWESYRIGQADTHVHQTLDMILKYDQVFADISYCCAFDRNLKRIQGWFDSSRFTDKEKAILLEKILFGTDYYLSDRKKNMITVIQSVYEELEDKLIESFCHVNPKRYLFA